jgi:tetratricopeptide (TPR) repeat protein
MSTTTTTGRWSEPIGKQAALSAAENAVAEYRRLADTDPERLPEFGAALRDLGVHLAQAGRHDDAINACLDAIRLFRELPADRFGRFGPELADTLHNLGVYLDRQDRAPEALAATRELVAVRSLLAATDPSAHDRQLGQATHHLADRMWRDGRRQEAVTTMQAAADLRRQLATDQPCSGDLPLAQSLAQLADWLVQLGRHDEAITSHRERLATLRRTVARNPGSAPALAGATFALCRLLEQLGRLDELLATTEDAVGFARQLATDHGDVGVGHLAVCLRLLGIGLAEAGRSAEAVAVSEEGVAIWRRLSAEWPDTYQGDLIASLASLSQQLLSADRHDEAVATAREVVEWRREQVIDRFPTADDHPLAGALGILADVLAASGAETEAVSVHRERIGVLQRLVSHGGASRYGSELGEALDQLRTYLGSLDRLAEMAAVSEEAVESARQLVVGRSHAGRPHLVLCLRALAVDLWRADRREDAVAAASEVVELLRQLASDDPATYRGHLADTLHNLGVFLASRGDDEAALAVTDEAEALYAEPGSASSRPSS